ncbi:MAG: T9SS type A sorting domain-containing protein [Sphingobacteriaceae bacterium]
MKRINYLVLTSVVLASTITTLQAQSKNPRAITMYPIEVIYPPETSLIAIYPNPASSSVEIQLKLDDKKGYVLEIYNQMGIRILQKNPWEGGPLDISRFEKGIYLVILKRDREAYSQKLIIDR